MLVDNITKKVESHNLSMRAKLTLSLSAIAAILLISSIISVMEYSRMSSYVSDLIADDIESINTARALGEATNAYNLEILAVIGDGSSRELPEFDQRGFVQRCESLRTSFEGDNLQPLADSVMYSYAAYMLASLELRDVVSSDFIDTREWYFDRLQAKYNRMSSDIDALSAAIYSDLKTNSETFQRGFYRSIIPGIVAVGVGLLLVLMLLFFILTYYVNPLYKMLEGLSAYRASNAAYKYTFEGDDQLSELNEGITEVIRDNQQLRRRIFALRKAKDQQ